MPLAHRPPSLPSHSHALRRLPDDDEDERRAGRDSDSDSRLDGNSDDPDADDLSSEASSAELRRQRESELLDPDFEREYMQLMVESQGTRCGARASRRVRGVQA